MASEDRDQYWFYRYDMGTNVPPCNFYHHLDEHGLRKEFEELPFKVEPFTGEKSRCLIVGSRLCVQTLPRTKTYPNGRVIELPEKFELLNYVDSSK